MKCGVLKVIEVINAIFQFTQSFDDMYKDVMVHYKDVQCV
jgi:hypothetical protein